MMAENRKRYKGILSIICSAFCFALMNMFVRLAGDIPSVQKSFFRNLVAFFFAIVIMKKEGIPFAVKKENRKDLILRSTFGTLGILCNFYAVDHLVLADASMLNKMSPFFVVLFSFFLLKENYSSSGSIHSRCIFRSLLVIKPTFSNMDFLPSLIGLAGGMGAGIAYTFVRKLSLHGEAGPVIVCFFSAFSCIVTLPFLLFDYHTMSGGQFVSLLFAGLSAAGGQFGITAAYSYAPAREISVYDYSQIIFSALLGFLVFGQIPDWLSWIGYGVICTMALLMFLYNQRKFMNKKRLPR